MKIYTRSGDAGKTGLFGGERVEKSDARVEAYGTIDELNAYLGICRGELRRAALEFSGESNALTSAAAELQLIQNELFVLGAELACQLGYEERLRMQLIDESAATRLERWIDAHDEAVAPLTQFILPSAGRAGGHLQYARALSRRAERRALVLPHLRDAVRLYLNRLSDYLFTLARRVDAATEEPEIPFTKS